MPEINIALALSKELVTKAEGLQYAQGFVKELLNEAMTAGNADEVVRLGTLLKRIDRAKNKVKSGTS